MSQGLPSRPVDRVIVNDGVVPWKFRGVVPYDVDLGGACPRRPHRRGAAGDPRPTRVGRSGGSPSVPRGGGGDANVGGFFCFSVGESRGGGGDVVPTPLGRPVKVLRRRVVEAFPRPTSTLVVLVPRGVVVAAAAAAPDAAAAGVAAVDVPPVPRGGGVLLEGRVRRRVRRRHGAPGLTFVSDGRQQVPAPLQRNWRPLSTASSRALSTPPQVVAPN